ncbi:MAG: succinate dehydrogenase iron-sulfur subunit [Pirellulales bacterium]|nr:succinate dehydrogenase iron-sulfur subunit [Pirellulales bacterium]
MSHSHNGNAHDSHGHGGAARDFEVRVLRQDSPGEPSYWERHRVTRELDMNVISVLQRIAAQSETLDGRAVTPVAWDCNCLEEVCGACTMVINGRVRQACTALVDRLLEDEPGQIELRPMTKFPVVRDLVVNRRRLFRALERVRAWNPVDGYYDLGPGPRQSPDEQQLAYSFSQCMSCGCCLDACPQYGKIDVEKREGETDDEHRARENEAYDTGFIGAHAMNQAVLFNSNPTGRMNSAERLEALASPGGVQVCGNAQNCVVVCPKLIPNSTAIGIAGRTTTVYKIKQWFGR